jgi:hypothetical protein
MPSRWYSRLVHFLPRSPLSGDTKTIAFPPGANRIRVRKLGTRQPSQKILPDLSSVSRCVICADSQAHNAMFAGAIRGGVSGTHQARDGRPVDNGSAGPQMGEHGAIIVCSWEE